MEGMCHLLDIQLLTVGDGQSGIVSAPYNKHRAILQEVTSLQDTLKQEKGKLSYLEQLHTALVLTTGIVSDQQVVATGIPALVTATNSTISLIVSISNTNQYMYMHKAWFTI